MSVMLDMLKKIKNKLKKKNDIEIPEGYIGVIDEVSCNKVRGWISYSNKSAITRNITIKVNELLIEVPKLNYREDLKLHGISEGYAAFDVEFEEDKSEEINIKVMVENEVILSRKLARGSFLLKNKDPYFIDFYRKSINKNTTNRLDDGLYIQPIKSSDYENRFSDKFFYRVSNSKFNDNHYFKTGQRLSDKLFSNDMIELIINSNKSLQVRVELIDKGKNVVAESRVDIQPGWRSYEVPLCIFDFESISKAVEIVLTFDMSCSSYIDLGALLVKDSSTQYFIEKPKLEKLNINLDKKYIINERLSNIRLTNKYKKLRKKQLICPGVIYEAKSDIDSEVNARASDKGIDIKIGQLNGYSRLVYSMDIDALMSKPLQGKISGTGECQKLIKAIYIYAKGKNDQIIRSIKVKTSLVDGVHQWGFILDYNSVCDLLSTTFDNYEYRLAVEFNANVEVENFALSLFQEVQSINEEVFSAIEDSAISSQIEVISGYFDVLKNDNKCSQVKSLNIKKIKHSEVDIVIPVYNAKEFVIKCLESIIKYTTVKYRIVIVDDCSTDGISEVLDEYAAKYDFLVVHHHKKNVGYTANVNKGFELAKSEWVLLLNSDTVVTPYWLENMLEATCEENVAIIGPLSNAASWQSVPKVFSELGGWDFNLLSNDVTPNDIAFQLNINRQDSYVEAGVLNGFCQLINREKFFEVGQLDEIAFPKGYGEENDLCARLIKHGYKLLVCPNSYVYHYKSKSFGHDTRAELSEKGSVALNKKHPDYDWGLVSKKLYNHDVMEKARRTIAPLYDL